MTDVAAERARQNALWGVQDHDEATWLAILTEEVGEVAKEVADFTAGARALNPRQYRTELVQVAAVAVAAIEALDRKPTRYEWLHEHVGEPMPASLQDAGTDDA